MTFQALIRLDGRTATGIEVPAAVLEQLAAGRRPAVIVTVNGYTWRTTVGSVGGRHLIPVSAEVRRRAGVQAGDKVTVDVALDTAPRAVAVPGDLAEALTSSSAAARFEALSPSARRRHVLVVEDARTAETRRRRIDRVVAELLSAG